MATAGCGAFGDAQLQNAENRGPAAQQEEAAGPADSAGPSQPVAPQPAVPPASPAEPVAEPVAEPARLEPQVGWSGIIGTGQSLSIGVAGSFVTPSPTLADAYMLGDANATWDIASPDAKTLQLAALREPFRTKPATTSYPANIAGQTPHTAMAQQVHQSSRALGLGPWITVHSATGLSGEPMSSIGPKGTLNAYRAGLFEARALSRLAAERNVKLHYDAVVLTHGESDENASSTVYDRDLLAMQAAYQQDLSAITGQGPAPIYLIVSQQSTKPSSGGPSAVAQAQWQVAINNPNAVLCAGPKYQYVYSSDALHLPATGYRRLGEKYGQVFAQSVAGRRPFLPLHPTGISRPDARTVRIAFDVPVPPLNWDAVLPVPHQQAHTAWAAGHGFEVRGAQGAEIGIAAATIDAAASTVDVVLTEDHPEALSIGYAMTSDSTSGNAGGLAKGRMGHLRDADPLEGASAEDIVCQATAGSAMLVCDRSMRHRAGYDVLEPGGHTLMALSATDPNAIVIEAPWAQASGQVPLRIHHEQRNYAVAFTLPVAALP